MTSYDSSLMYKNKLHRDYAYWSLISTSIRHFKSAYAISNIKKLDNKLKKILGNFGKIPDWPYLDAFTRENLIDSIKILICFENYLKGKLIYKGYLVHNINKKICNGKFKKLKNITKDPLRFIEYKKIETYMKLDKSDLYTLRGIKTNSTITISTLLHNQKYQSLLEIPSEINNILIDMNKIRNTLHFNSKKGVHYGQNTVKDYKKLIKFVNKNIIKKQNAFVRKYKPKQSVSRFLEEPMQI